MTEENKMFQEIDEHVSNALQKRNETLSNIDDLTRSYEKGIATYQVFLRKTDQKIKEHSDGKVDTFHKLKKVVQNIEIYEKNKNMIYRKLTILNSRKKGLVELYKILIHGGLPKRESLEDPMLESYLKLYDERFASLLEISEDDVSAMFSRKDDYVNGINLFFSRLQEDIHDIDDEINRLVELENDINVKLATSKLQQEKLQKNYAIFTECIKNAKMELGSLLKDEKELMADFERLLSNLKSLLTQEEEVAARLRESLKVSKQSHAPESIEHVENVDDENIHKDEAEIENSAVQVQEVKKAKAAKPKKAKADESILSPVVEAEVPEKSVGKAKRDSILSSVEEETDIEKLLRKDSGMMLKHDEHLLLDLSETLQ